MPTTDPATHDLSKDRFTLLCLRCDRPMIVQVRWSDREVQCPHCQSVNTVPPPPESDSPARGKPPAMRGNFGFNFTCPRCDVLLEAHTGMSGNPGRCPACGTRLQIPFIQRNRSTPEKAKVLEADPEPLNPVHAYAVDGVAAPEIVKLGNDAPMIKCPACGFLSEIDAAACEQCEAPFTLEAAQTHGEIRRDRYSMLASILGVVGLVTFPLFIPALAAAYLGARSLLYVGYGQRSHLGWVGLSLGLLGTISGIGFWYWQLLP